MQYRKEAGVLNRSVRCAIAQHASHKLPVSRLNRQRRVFVVIRDYVPIRIGVCFYVPMMQLPPSIPHCRFRRGARRGVSVWVGERHSSRIRRGLGTPSTVYLDSRNCFDRSGSIKPGLLGLWDGPGGMGSLIITSLFIIYP